MLIGVVVSEIGLLALS